MTIQADGRTWTVWTRATAADRVLAGAGVSLHPAERVTTTPRDSATIPACVGDRLIQVARAVPVTLHEDGRTVSFVTAAPTVGRALEELGLAIYRADRVRPTWDSPYPPGCTSTWSAPGPLRYWWTGRRSAPGRTAAG